MSKPRTVSKRNYAIPGKTMSESEFKVFLEEGEKGSFLSIEESKKKFNEWRKKYYKL
ncbi:MAG: hypothetical protein ACYDCN_11540 [Bacteroidia bacterium]